MFINTNNYQNKRNSKVQKTGSWGLATTIASAGWTLRAIGDKPPTISDKPPSAAERRRQPALSILHSNHPIRHTCKWEEHKEGQQDQPTRSRYEGDGVRYKAKLIGLDLVPDPQGEKMLLDSMMKLKGFEVSARKQGQHKMRIWLKISSSGLKILDERTGVSQKFFILNPKRTHFCTVLV
uniref:PID domain-containing protein n=1 Tax=Poecilia reticulata TaxID=8081 RepID=A0A3P9QI11_POERE